MSISIWISEAGEGDGGGGLRQANPAGVTQAPQVVAGSQGGEGGKGQALVLQPTSCVTSSALLNFFAPQFLPFVKGRCYMLYSGVTKIKYADNYKILKRADQGHMPVNPGNPAAETGRSL